MEEDRGVDRDPSEAAGRWTPVLESRPLWEVLEGGYMCLDWRIVETEAVYPRGGSVMASATQVGGTKAVYKLSVNSCGESILWWWEAVFVIHTHARGRRDFPIGNSDRFVHKFRRLAQIGRQAQIPWRGALIDRA